MRVMFCLLIVCGLVPVVSAEKIIVVDEKTPVVIPFSQSRTLQFANVRQAGQTVLLRIKSRMDCKSLGGSLFFMRLTLNGREIQPTKGRSACRLINKPLVSPVTPTMSNRWYDTAGWMVVYAPDFKAAYSKKFYVDDPYLYVLDITDLVNPLAENRLEIQNTAQLSFIQRHKFPGEKLDLVVGMLEILIKPGASPLMAATESAAATVINRGEPAAGPAKYRGELLPGGGVAVHCGKSTYRFTSRLSVPGGTFNRLTDRKEGNGWKVSIEENRVSGQCAHYTLARTVRFTPRRIEIADALTNRTSQPLGLSVHHELDLIALDDPPIRLAGNPDPTIMEYHSWGNPSVHIVTPEGGLGFIAEDDVFRNQAKIYVQADQKSARLIRAGVGTQMLRLAPGETYTLQWSVYPVAGPDYYDFVNLVREDWDANYTVLGPWRWGFHGVKDMSVEQIRDVIRRQGIRYFIAHDWVEWVPNEKGTQRIAYGTEVMDEYWAPRREFYAGVIEKIRRAAPEVKLLAYYNAMRESIDGTPQRFADSLMTDPNGQPFVTLWTPNPGATNPTYTMIPTLKNSFGKAMLDTARWYFTGLKLDGIYYDEIEGIQFGQLMITYSNVDGHSCLLDPKTFAIQREVGIGPLASRPFHNALASLIRSRNGVFLANGPTGSKDTLRDRVQRMVEVQHNDYYAFEGNLQTPLGYMSWKSEWPDFLRTLRMAMLPAVCQRTELPHDISPYMFPFTPIELHAGYLLGRERLITIHSGNYGWPKERVLARVRHFDMTGKLTRTDFPTTLSSEARTKVVLKDKEALVLERLPITFAPKDQTGIWTATAQKVHYDQETISLHLAAPRGGLLKIRDSDFRLPEGFTVTVRIGSESRSVAVANGVLTVTVPEGFTGDIAITRK